MKTFKWWEWALISLPVAAIVYIGRWAFFVNAMVQETWGHETKILFGVIGILFIFTPILFLKGWYFEGRQRKSEKVINLALSHIERLENELAEQYPSAAMINKLPNSEHWPWGDHHTEQLGHLAAAARRFWKLYDPTDIGTAPMNRDVSKWLVTERKVSKTMADAMATMLRIDGLRTGPRE